MSEETSCDLVCNLDKDYFRLVDHISKLPHKILRNYHLDSLPQLILHELSGESGFRLKKAVYLVDNPDFDHLVGAAGFSIEGACLYKEVKKISRPSLKRKCEDFCAATEDVKAIGDAVGMNEPEVFCWPMKHGNYGVLIFEGEELSDAHRSLLSNSVALLSLCGI